jgi:hypothetical protein
MNYKLSMKQHCIETKIKKRYNKTIFEYFKAGRKEYSRLRITINGEDIEP